MATKISATVSHAVEHFMELLQEGLTANSALSEVARIYGFPVQEIQSSIDASSTVE